jgi:hypothetical protein
MRLSSVCGLHGDIAKQQWIHSPLSSYAHQLTLCMLAFWSCEGVVFLVLSVSSHLTVSHVSPLPMSGANWRSLFLLWGFGSPLPQDGAPIHRVRTHSLSRVQDKHDIYKVDNIWEHMAQTPQRIPSIIPLDNLDNSPFAWWTLPVPESLLLTWNHSFACGATPVHSGPRLLVNWPPPPLSLPIPFSCPPTVPHSNYVPFYNDITTPTSYSLIQFLQDHFIMIISSLWRRP